MERVAEALLVAGRGLAGNIDQGGRRQITVIDERAWRDAMLDLGADLDPSARRANVMLRGIDLRDSRGRVLRIGECAIRIGSETRPCAKMEIEFHGLREVLKKDWRGGVTAEIVRGGTICIGDAVAWGE